MKCLFKFLLLKICWVVCVVIFCNIPNYCVAQSNYVYEDTALANTPDSSVHIQEDEESVDQKDQLTAEDTLLINNNLIIKYNWLNLVKKEKDLLYTAKLEDKLIKAQQEKASQQKTTNNNPSWIFNFFASSITQALFWGIGIFIILFVLYKLYLSGGFFNTNTKSFKTTHQIEEEEETLENIDVAPLLQKAIQAGNYRLAIRYLFLQNLQKLAKYKIIVLATHKTNKHYFQDISNRTLAKEFASISTMYEYAWYGNYEISQQNFVQLQKKFSDFNLSIPNN
jgi:hypothetical protein